MFDKFCDQSITWEKRGVNIPLLIINKDKIGKKLIQLRYVKNLKWLTAFLLFDMHNPFSSTICMYNVTSFYLPAVKSNGLIGVTFLLMYSFVSALKLDLSLLILLSFFLLSRAFLQCFLLPKQIIVFLDLVFLSVFPNRWQASFLQIAYSLQCLIRLKKLCFPVDYLVYFLEYLIKLNCFFYHTGRGGKKSPHPKICHTYPTMMQLGTVIHYLKKIQKIYESRETPSEFCLHQHFFTGNQQILLYQEIQIQIAFWYIISNSFNFWVFKEFFW